MMSFVEDIRKFQSNTECKASQIARKVGLDLHSRIVGRTPVDTGRLRANNQLAIGSKPATSTIGKDKGGELTIAKGRVAMGGYSLGDDIWIANNVEYASVIEFKGHSKQAPAGFFRVSIADIVNTWPNIVRITR
mgnify:CR=1 FL=1